MYQEINVKLTAESNCFLFWYKFTTRIIWSCRRLREFNRGN